MTRSTESTQQRPPFELRCGNVLHVTVHRVPGWLVAAVATATGSGLAAYFTSR
ncbi:hypothetical protein M2271_002426 [Streptomyces sp. LBL]|uniref:hypothetical protein n=1 Tax=Streptomyces sp. LBL TaxID=2940562 RepID=UPI0024768E4A|nr:hypothetical protein [Streptomyces sp. LBL]MDH6624622.1 hypothetical protein [Streptomyces sp. LBL]